MLNLIWKLDSLLSTLPLAGFQNKFELVCTRFMSLHRLDNRTRPISAPYNGQCWGDSNLHTSTCESPALATIVPETLFHDALF